MQDKVYDVEAIYRIIYEEQKSWIPGEGLGHFTPRGSSSWDTDWWYFRNDDHDYLYLEREWWYHVTVQRCDVKGTEHHYWNVYIEKDITDGDSVRANQTVSHTFRWVRSLKHALYLWEIAQELNLQVAHYEDFFLTKEEYDKFYE